MRTEGEKYPLVGLDKSIMESKDVDVALILIYVLELSGETEVVCFVELFCVSDHVARGPGCDVKVSLP